MERDRIVLWASAILAIAACASPAPPPASQKLALGAVQHEIKHEIKAGLEQAAVLQALGPATRISTDSQQREVWTYENIASDRIDTESSVGGSLIVLSDARSAADVSATDQRTLTLIIYYDEAKKVREFAYNYSSP